MISHQELTWYAMHDVSLGKIQLLLFKLSPCLEVCTYRVFGFCWAENLNTDQQSVNWTSDIISIGSHGYDYWKSSGSCVILNVTVCTTQFPHSCFASWHSECFQVLH